MMVSPTTLLGNSLVFDRTGQTLVAVEPDAISVVELGSGGQTTRLPIREARAVAAFADQLWIATHDDQLARVDHAGRSLGPVRSLPFAARAMLQPAPCGPTAAVWSSSPALALIDDFGQLAATELGDVELALPLTGRRFVTARGAKLTLPSGLVTTLPPNTTVLGGAVMADGKSVTLLAAHAGGRQLIVVSLGTGQITQRCALLSSTVRLAIRRGLAIVQLESRVLRMLDLHAGRELGTLRFDHDVDDFVVDLDGQRLAVRAGHGAIELHQLVDLLRRPAASIQAAPEPELPDTTAKGPTVEPDVITSAPRGEQAGPEASDDDGIAKLMRRAAADIRATRTIVSGGPEAVVRASDPGSDSLAPRATAELRNPLACPALTALDPRTRPIEIDRALARDQLGRELRTVALWTLGAIAAAWDQRMRRGFQSSRPAAAARRQVVVESRRAGGDMCTGQVALPTIALAPDDITAIYSGAKGKDGVKDAEIATMIARGKEHLLQMNAAFETMGIDTIQAQALFLAHQAGETGGGDKMVEAGAKKRPYAPFQGRGPLQVTNKAAYIRTLAYLETRADQLTKTIADKTTQKTDLEKTAKPSDDQKKQLESVKAEIDKLAKQKADIDECVKAVKADVRQAANPKYAYLFSAAYMHASGGVESSGKVGETTTFDGRGPDEDWESGGNSQVDLDDPTGKTRKQYTFQQYRDLEASKGKNTSDMDSAIARGKVKQAVYAAAYKILKDKVAAAKAQAGQQPASRP